MNRCGVTSILTAVTFGVGALLLTSCGSAGVDRAALKQEILTNLESEVGTTPEQARCFANTVDQLSDSDLSALNASPVPQEVQDKLVALLTPCMTSLGSPAASPS